MVATYMVIITAAVPPCVMRTLGSFSRDRRRRDEWWSTVWNFIKVSLGHRKLPENTGENKGHYKKSCLRILHFFDLEINEMI